jgi:hypothetical protein
MPLLSKFLNGNNLMRWVRLVGFSILVLTAAVIFLFALFPSSIRISRVIRIKCSREELLGRLEDLRQWPAWNHLARAPALIHPEIVNSAGDSGLAIQSDELRIKRVSSSPDSVITEWRQQNGKTFRGGFIIHPDLDGQVILEWYFLFHFRWYPWEKLGSMFYDRGLGPEMEISLADLRNQCEAKDQRQTGEAIDSFDSCLSSISSKKR